MTWRDAAERHARDCYPREACGLVVVKAGREVYWPCQNVAGSADHFEIAADDYAAAEDAGEIVGVFHSHPDSPPEPSPADRVGCEASGVPWHILSVPSMRWHAFEPNGYEAPLVGRVFEHGVLDCYAIIRDWYRIERGIILPDYPRRHEWWLHGDDLYRQHFRDAGFYRTDEPMVEGDVLLMQVGAPVPNHAAIYLDGDQILHHLQGRLSSRDVYGGYWRRVTVMRLRHA